MLVGDGNDRNRKGWAERAEQEGEGWTGWTGRGGLNELEAGAEPRDNSLPPPPQPLHSPLDPPHSGDCWSSRSCICLDCLSASGKRGRPKEYCLLLFKLHYCLVWGAGTGGIMCLPWCTSGGQTEEFTLSFHHMGPGNQTQVFRLGQMPLLAGPFQLPLSSDFLSVC